MPRDFSITDEYIVELQAKFAEKADHVRAAPDWPETQRRMVTGTYPYKIAMDRVEQGWTREEIEKELKIRIGFGELPNPIHVIGNRRLDEEAE